MVQKKLQVLTEAGLAIDDFSEVESTALHDLKVVRYTVYHVTISLSHLCNKM